MWYVKKYTYFFNKQAVFKQLASVRKIKAELLRQYVMSLKKVVCKDRASRNGMQ